LIVSFYIHIFEIIPRSLQGAVTYMFVTCDK